MQLWSYAPEMQGCLGPMPGASIPGHIGHQRLVEHRLAGCLIARPASYDLRTRSAAQSLAHIWRDLWRDSGAIHRKPLSRKR